jgi:putative Mn2+ efflux pump MntP
VLKLAVLLLPLCLDTLAVATAVGMTDSAARQRLRLGLLFALFEGGMPVVGLLLGVVMSRLVGDFAEYVAAAGLIALGVYMLLADDAGEGRRARGLVSGSGLGLIATGMAVSLDELAIGLSLGLLRVALAAAVALIAAQAFAVSQLGLELGKRARRRVGEGAEKLAGGLLIAIGVILLASKLANRAL